MRKFWENEILFGSLTTGKAFLVCLEDGIKRLCSVAVYDAENFARLGEIFLNTTPPKNRFESLIKPETYEEVSEKLFARALELDPKNNLKYYYGFLSAQKKQGKPIDKNSKREVLNLLAEYKIALSNNQKLTVLTENPEYAVKLYDFFGMKKESENLRQIWLGEMIKFAVKYGGKQLTPLSGDN